MKNVDTVGLILEVMVSTQGQVFDSVNTRVIEKLLNCVGGRVDNIDLFESEVYDWLEKNHGISRTGDGANYLKKKANRLFT